MALPANIASGGEYNVVSIAASSNKGMLIRFLNEQVEEGFYALVIDYLKDNNFDLSAMMVDEEVKAQCSKLYELATFVDENIKQTGKYEIEEWIEPLFKFVYGDIDPGNTDATISTAGIYRYSIWLIYLYQNEQFGDAMRLIGERIAPLLINTYYQIVEIDDRPKYFDKAVMGYLDLMNVVMEMNLPASLSNSEAYLNNLEVLYDYTIEDENVGNDYKIQFSIGLFNALIAMKNYEKTFEFYSLNAEHIPVDNIRVYESFRELIHNCNSTQDTNVLSRNIISAISKQDIYNKRIDTLIGEVSAFVKKVYQYIENEPEMKKNIQILGVGSALEGKNNVFEGLYEYNLVFHECGIKDLVNQDVSGRSWEEKYEVLDLLYTTLNVIFDGYNVYEISNKIEHQYVELNWIGDYVNANPSLLKLFFSIKEKIRAFRVRKNSILEKSKTNYEIKKLLEDRQKHLVFMAARDMIAHGVNNAKTTVIGNSYDSRKAEQYLAKTFSDITLPSRYAAAQQPQTTSKFSFGKHNNNAENQEYRKLMANSEVADMLCKSEWLWYQYIERGKDKQTQEEVTYSVACLIRIVELLIARKSQPVPKTDAPNKKVIITKTGKVIELSDESSSTAVSDRPQELNVMEFIDNIGQHMTTPTDENISYVKAYIEDWLNFLLNNKFDKNLLLSVFEAEEMRSKTLQIIKKMIYDLKPLN
ncbi:MAG: hypothetical protein K2G89_07645 [Lachnospiraceae bacterium]|nr:hypothetical protein [Lachnospiraceae bacterium]